MTSPSTATDAPFDQHVARLAESAPRWLEQARCSGAALSELFYEQTIHHQTILRQRAHPSGVGIPQWHHQHVPVSGVGIRALRGTAFGYATTETLTTSALQQTARNAAEQLLASTIKPPCLTETPRVDLNLLDTPTQISTQEKQALMQAAADAAFSWDANVRQVTVMWQDRIRQFFVANSMGTRVANRSVLMGMQVSVVFESSDRSLSGKAFAGSAAGFFDFLTYDVEALGRIAVEQAQTRAKAQSINSESLPVILAGGWGGVWLHEAIGHMLEADVHSEHISPYSDRVGQHVAPSMVTLIDDATYSNGRGTFAYDDEGAPAQRTVLIDQGIVQNVLTDHVSASKHKLSITGNARRQDYRFAPLPRMTNLLLAPQPNTPEALITDVPDGLYVESIRSGVVNPDEDTFSFDVVTGYRIENGRLTSPVSDVRLMGKPSTALTSICGIADDLQIDAGRGMCKKQNQTVPISVGMPTVLLTDLSIQPISA